MSEHPTSPLSDRFTAAVEYAVTAHQAQRRKGSDVPYVAHVLAVSSLVLEMGASEDEAIAGLLHDVMEDVGADQEAVIEARFGPDVAAIVRANSDTDELPKPPWLARKQDYIASIAAKSPPALRVSDRRQAPQRPLDPRRPPPLRGRHLRSVQQPRGGTIHEQARRSPLGHQLLVEAFDRRREDLGPGGAAKLTDLAHTVAELRSATSG